MVLRGLATTPAFCLMTLCASPPSAMSQCPGVCGDVNVSGTVTSGDLLDVLDFLYRDSLLASDVDCADIDNHDLVNLGDVWNLSHFIFLGGQSPICPSELGPIAPTPTLGFRIEYPGLIPANASSAAIPFWLLSPMGAYAVNIAVRLSVEGTAPAIDSVVLHDGWDVGLSHVEPPGAPPGSLVAGLFSGYGNSTGGESLLTVYITVAPSSHPRQISVEHLSLPPLMDDEFGVPRPVHYTMMLAVPSFDWVRDSAACAVWHTGDVNLDLALTSADVIWIVNYVFKSGFEPFPCPAAADVNCSSQATSADVIFLVNHVFKGGPAPCDVCTLIPGTWSCASP
jgi:hypothetical protein